jgi:hypothetical protein
MNEAPKPSGKVTHAFVASSKDDKGVERKFQCARTANGDTLVRLITKWPGVDDEAETRIGLTQTGLMLLAEALNEAICNMDAWPLKAVAPEKQGGHA